MKKLRFLILAAIVLATVVVFSLSANAAVIASGNCGDKGDNVKWSLDDTGTLTISGSGKMQDYPWVPKPGNVTGIFPHTWGWNETNEYLASKVKKVVVLQGVTKIGDYAFDECKNLNCIEFSDSVTYIGDGAFSETAIKSITLPKNIEYLGVSVDCEGTVAIDGVIFSANKKVLIKYPQDRVDDDGVYIVPKSVKCIAAEAFQGITLDELVLPEDLKYIASGAFSYFDGKACEFNRLVIPSTVEDFGTLIGPGNTICPYGPLNDPHVEDLIVLSNEACAINNHPFDSYYTCNSNNIYCYRGSATDKWYQNANNIVYYGYGASRKIPIHYIDGHTHTYDNGVVLKQGSCTEEGLKVYTCTNCFINPGMKKYEALSGGGHSYTSDITKSATCTSTGTKKYTCSVCGDTYTETIVKAEHTCEKWFVIVPAKAGVEGRECGICNVCGAVAIRSVAALPKDRPVFRLTSAETENGYAVTLSLENNVNGFNSLDIVVKYDTAKLKCVKTDASNAVAKFEAGCVGDTILVNYADTAFFASKGELCTIYFEPAEELPTGNTDVVINAVLSENPYTAVNCTIDLSEEVPETTTVIMTIGQAAGFVSGKAFALDAAPIIRNDRTMLPVRFVAEAFGAEVGWDGTTSTATVKTEDTEIAITIGESTAIVNGEEVTLDSPAFIENSRTYLPVRFVAEKLGASVAWDGTTSTATLTK